jgi:hypothetical protein
MGQLTVRFCGAVFYRAVKRALAPRDTARGEWIFFNIT